MNIYWGTGAALVGYLVLAWITGSFLHLDTTRFYLLFAILSALGISGAAVFIWYRSRKTSSGDSSADASAAPAHSDQEIDALIREAEARLPKGTRLAGLPVVFVVGDTGSTKTSTVLHSGLDPELLAGQTHQDNNVVPTRTANIWFARQMILLEAGGRLLGDPSRWLRLLASVRPGRLKSVVGAGGAAPRAALVCVDAETFTQQGAAEAVASAARLVQTRLSGISQQFGISFPVYVLFTKMNRLAFFEDLVRNLTNEEATEVLGATLPMRVESATGVYAEEETRRLAIAFDEVFYSLADHRIDLLPRESDAQKVAGAYEFPREFRKLRATLVQFLVDVCRPSQLRASPFLRGFYFSGVRPVAVQETAVAEAQRPATQRSPFETAATATGVFKVGGTPPPPPLSTPAPLAGATRKVPQWLFLSHLFHDVILKDEAALGASGSSTKTSMLRRILLASAAALLLIFIIGMTVSFFGNRSLEAEALEAAKGIPAAEASGMNLPTPEALQKLENLRQTLERLTAYEKDGAPWRLRWLLYSGGDMLPKVRRIYYTRFHQLLFAQTQSEILSSLQRLQIPPAPTDEYGRTYDALKAYLITTAEWKRSTDWLSPVLIAHWSAGRSVDALLPLAKKQFDFYSVDLARGNPFSEQNEASVIDRARLHLARFSGTEQIYQFMLADASRRARKVNFNEQFPGSAEVVLNNRDVAGAFTKAGWAAMQDNIKRSDKFFGGERWVLGDYAAAKPDAAKLEEELRSRYSSDYIAKWREFLKNTAVARYTGLQDAARKLNILSGAQTPLLALFWVATQNTSVDSPRVTEAFDAVQKVVPPPATVVQYVWPQNQEYMGSLAALQTVIGQVAEMTGPPDPNRAMPVRSSADAARNVVKKMGYTFRIDPEAHVETITLKLLQAPIDYADALTKGMGAGEINAKARQFCVAYAPVSNKFPFNPNATAEATLEEVNAIFRPREGRLWLFYEDALRNFLQKQGAQYVPNPAGGIALNPAFVAFFNQAAQFSDAVYPGGAMEAALRYSLQPQRSEQIKSMTFAINGQSAKFSGQEPARQYVWPGPGAHSVRLSAKLSGGSDFDFQNRDGLWSVFRFFADADRWGRDAGGYNLEWVVRQGREGRPVTIGGKELTYRFVLNTGGLAPVFQKEFLNSMKCVSQAAR
jgi:type VI secretion system protein ImpL